MENAPWAEYNMLTLVAFATTWTGSGIGRMYPQIKICYDQDFARPV